MECLKPIGKAQRIAQLNDELRHTFRGGRVLMTSGFDGLRAETQLNAVRAIQAFSDFTPDNDPYGEHDFGRLEVDGVWLMFKVDYRA